MSAALGNFKFTGAEMSCLFGFINSTHAACGFRKNTVFQKGNMTAWNFTPIKESNPRSWLMPPNPRREKTSPPGWRFWRYSRRGRFAGREQQPMPAENGNRDNESALLNPSGCTLPKRKSPAAKGGATVVKGILL
jgi:hypothetical protein